MCRHAFNCSSASQTSSSRASNKMTLSKTRPLTTSQSWNVSHILAPDAGSQTVCAARIRRILKPISKVRVHQSVALCLAVAFWPTLCAKAQTGPAAKHEPVMEADPSAALLDKGFQQLYELKFEGARKEF